MLKILLDQMYDGMEDMLKALGYEEVISVNKLKKQGHEFPNDLAIARYAKEKKFIIITQNDDMASICKASDTDLLHLDFAILAKVVDRELKSRF